MAKALSAAQRRAVAGSEPATGRLSARPEVCTALVAVGLAVPHERGGHHAYYLTTEGLRLRAELARAAEAPGGTGSGPHSGSGSALAAGPSGAPDPRPGSHPAKAPDTAGGFTADDGTSEDDRGDAGDTGDGGQHSAGGAHMGADRTGANRSPGAGAVEPPRSPAAAARRAAEVAAAWEGLLQIRAVLLDGVTDVPAPWERERRVHAVSLALEAAGCPPARPGSPGYRVTAAAESGMAEVTWSVPDAAAAALARCAALLGPRGWQCTEHRTRAGHPFLVVSPRR